MMLLTIVTLMFCGGGASNEKADAEGFTVIESEIKSKFGADA